MKRWLHLSALACALTLCICRPAWAQDNDSLVLVTGVSSEVGTMNAGEVRRSFMGLTVSVPNGTTVRPLINNAQTSLREAFLQHVVGMSDLMYRRRVLTLALRQGVTTPRTFDSEATLAQELRTDPNAVSYMWASTAERMPGIRVVRTLWQP